ncbi:MAG: phosphoribosyltransferase family protein [Pseudomonadota bacterium]
MNEKTYLDAQQLLDDSFRLAADIYASDFRPSAIIAVWRGGAPMGLAVQEFMAYLGVASDHIAIRTSSYQGVDQRSREVAVYGLSYLVKSLTYDDQLLIVDDVFDTGHTIAAIIDQLRAKLRRNMPADVRIAVPYYKPTRNQTDLVPDYYLHETAEWLKYPHSLEGLSAAEIAEHRPRIYEILKSRLPDGAG